MKWEYKVVHLYSSIIGLERVCNNEGRDGWELVSFFQADLRWQAIFKRPKAS